MKAVLIEVDVAGVRFYTRIQGLRERLVPSISQIPDFVCGTGLTGTRKAAACRSLSGRTSQPRWRSPISLMLAPAPKPRHPLTGARFETSQRRREHATTRR